MPKKIGRPSVSCAECKRSKLKCERERDKSGAEEWPCAQCRRRGCASLCPEGIVEARTSVRELREEIVSLKRQLAEATACRSQAPTLGQSGGSSSTPTPGPTLSLGGPTSATSPEDIAEGLTTVGQLSISPGGRSRFYPPTAAAHVLPDDGDDEANKPGIAEGITFPFFLQDRSAFLAEARASLPAYEEMQILCEVYWSATCWRFVPISRSYLDVVLLEVYGNSRQTLQRNDASQLALVFAVSAVGSLFDEREPPYSEKAFRFDRLSLACLGAADFLTNTSVASLATLHLHYSFVLNAGGRRAEELYAVVGLALRLAILAGFHRDGAWWRLQEREVNARRRVWWELLTLERINSNRFGCPPSIQPGQFDTLRPSDTSDTSYLYWRWEWDDILHRLMNECINSEDNEKLRLGDRTVREFWNRLPPNLKFAGVMIYPAMDSVPLSSRRLETSEQPADDKELLGQIRLSLHHNTGMLHLHRAAFSTALKESPHEPLESPQVASVLVVINEACVNVIDIAAYVLDKVPMVSRHSLTVLDLYSSLVPLAAFVCRSPHSKLANECHHHLMRGVTLLEATTTRTPCDWYGVLCSRGQKLAAQATNRLMARWSMPSTDTLMSRPENDEVDAMLGRTNKLREQVLTAVPATPAIDENIAPDFDMWLSAFWPSTENIAPPTVTTDDGTAFSQLFVPMNGF